VNARPLYPVSLRPSYHQNGFTFTSGAELVCINAQFCVE